MLLDCEHSADTVKQDKIFDTATEIREHHIKWFKHIGVIENFNIPVFHEA
jgi:hypothetical protein